MGYLLHILSLLCCPMFFGIGQGPSGGQRTAAGNIGTLAGWDTSTGENLVTTGTGELSTAANFWDAILSGNPTAISQVLGPQISGIENRASQSELTTSEFGDRSGGTNAAIQSISDTDRAAVNNLIGTTTATAATQIGQLGATTVGAGENLTGQALSGDIAEFGAQTTMQGESASMWNDIFNSIAQIGLGAAQGVGLT